MAAVNDGIDDIGGKLKHEQPAKIETVDALHQIRGLGGFGEIVLVCPTPAARLAAEDFRAHVMRELIHAGRSKDLPRWVMLVSESAARPQHGGEPPLTGAHRPELVVYQPKRLDKLTRQLRWLRRPPRGVVVFDRSCDFPVLRGRYTLHVLDDDSTKVMIERDGLRRKLSLALRWACLGFKAVLHAVQLQTHHSHKS